MTNDFEVSRIIPKECCLCAHIIFMIPNFIFRFRIEFKEKF